MRWVSSRTGKGHEPAKPADAKKGGRSAFALLFSDRDLVMIAGMWLVLNAVNTVGEYVLDEVMQEQFAAEGLTGDALSAAIRGFKSTYFFWFNTIGFLLQLFVAGRVMKRGGAGLTILILPIVSLIGQGAIAATGVALSAVMVANVAYNAVNYSIQNTGRNALFLVTPSEVKYKVKVLIDSVLQRVGDVMAAGIVLVGSGVLGLSPMTFVIVNGVITLLWLLITVLLAREHHARAEARAAEG
jgi:AAA family ATP:ADP antiporter